MEHRSFFCAQASQDLRLDWRSWPMFLIQRRRCRSRRSRRLYVLLQIPHRYSPSAVGCDGGGGSWWQLLWGWPFRVPDFLDSVPEMPLFVDEVSDTVCVWSLSVMVIAGIA